MGRMERCSQEVWNQNPYPFGKFLWEKLQPPPLNFLTFLTTSLIAWFGTGQEIFKNLPRKSSFWVENSQKILVLSSAKKNHIDEPRKPQNHSVQSTWTEKLKTILNKNPCKAIKCGKYLI